MTTQYRYDPDGIGAMPRVCDIRFRRNDEHEALVLLAWKRRQHPAWSQHAVSYEVAAA